MTKKKAQGRGGITVAIVDYFGPTDTFATKAVVSIVNPVGTVIQERKWLSPIKDIRDDDGVRAEIVSFVREYGVKSVMDIDEVIGCPHERGKDYPEGIDCPMCPFWAGFYEAEDESDGH